MRVSGRIWRGLALTLGIGVLAAVSFISIPPRDGPEPSAPPGFVALPPGAFVMGSPDDEAGRTEKEGPQRAIRLTRPIHMQQHEVTQAEWRAYMATSPAHFADCDDCPVEQVNWFEAVAFANARSAAEGLPLCYRLDACEGRPGAGCDAAQLICDDDAWRCGVVEFAGLDCPGYRLPTEAEWEYAARADSTGRYEPGEAEADLARVGWFAGNSDGRPHPVGQKPANRWGLVDMHGNVYEWCNDHFARYTGGSATDPTGPADGEFRALRGGSYDGTARWSRSAFRNGWWPVRRSRWLGFRLVRTAGGAGEDLPRENTPGGR